jgi:hypothetical protein
MNDIKRRKKGMKDEDTKELLHVEFQRVYPLVKSRDSAVV